MPVSHAGSGDRWADTTASVAKRSPQLMRSALSLRTRSTSPASLAGDASFEPKASVRVNPPGAARRTSCRERGFVPLLLPATTSWQQS
jgi:hypothetical protein